MNSLLFSIHYTRYLPILVIFLCTACVTSATEEKPLVLSGATLIDGTGNKTIENSLIVIKGDRIECAGTATECSVPADAEVINVSGKYITPGMIDAHMHFAQTGFFDGRPDAMDITEAYPLPEIAAYQKMHPERYYQTYLCSGVTGIYDVGGFTWSVDQQFTAEDEPMAPHVAAAGPLLTPAQGAPFDLPSDKVLVPLNSVEDGITTVKFLSELGSTGIKFWQLRAGDEAYMERVEAAAEEIRKQGNQMIAHATTLEQAKAALRNGTKLLVHSVGDREVDDEFIQLAKENGTYYNPTLIVSAGYTLAFRAAAGIEALPFDDPNGCVDQRTLDLVSNASQFKDHPRFSNSFLDRLNQFDPATDMVSSTDLLNLKKVYDAGIPVVVGTDAGNPGTLHGVSIFDEMEAMQGAGIDPSDLIVMATKNGAESMRRGNDFGTIEKGKIGNLIIMTEDPTEDIAHMRTLTHVMVKGILHDIKDLSANVE
ncbi:amidohydrolase family protein [Balneola sp. MJW-20]|uniref:amidohydrolase family protein n=1 Tax=Gracilimonas aurantiaca TaxID=3234185 RepID=UPI0034678841